MAFIIEPYTAKCEQSWNSFVKENHFHFMFLRSYMEYHSDRFVDQSWMVFDDDELIGIVPANKEGEVLVSHRGLTFGGILVSSELSCSKRISCYEWIFEFLRSVDVDTFLIKIPPSIYFDFDPILSYALWRGSAWMHEQQITLATKKSSIDNWSTRRKRGLRKAKRKNVEVQVATDFKPFWNDVLIPVLRRYHQTAPTHSLAEIQSLASKHDDILQVEATMNGQAVAGITLYRTPTVIHAQYIASNEVGRSVGALEAVVEFCLLNLVTDEQWFNFGSVNESGGLVVNSGLLDWKEEFAAIPFLHTSFTLNVANATSVA